MGEPGGVADGDIPVTLVRSKQKSTMRFLPRILTVTALCLLAACSTPDKRIGSNRAAFDQFPADVQEKVRAGRVDLGFTGDMVLIALGEPARRLFRKTEAGDVELWVYNDEGPHFSFGVGVGTGGRRSDVAGGVALSTAGSDDDEKMRVELRDGKVSAIEYVKK
jgi:hypothetical protein